MAENGSESTAREHDRIEAGDGNNCSVPYKSIGRAWAFPKREQRPKGRQGRLRAQHLTSSPLSILPSPTSPPHTPCELETTPRAVTPPPSHPSTYSSTPSLTRRCWCSQLFTSSPAFLLSMERSSSSSPPSGSSPAPGPPSIPPRGSHKRKSGSCDDIAHLRLLLSIPTSHDTSPDTSDPSLLSHRPSLLHSTPHSHLPDLTSPTEKRLCLFKSTEDLPPSLPLPPSSSPLPFPKSPPSSSPPPLSFSLAVPSPYTNSLSSLISQHLPPVLTDLVMTYYSAILPSRHHYTGHSYLDNNAYFRFANEYRVAPAPPLSLSPPLRLDVRSFSWSGWMNRVTTADNQFLFSFSNPHLHIPGMLSNLHVGYRHYQINQRHVDCFTFGFWCNDLDAKHAADVTQVDQWEHWAGTFEYPVSSPLPSLTSSIFSLLPPSMALPSLSSPSLGHRRLYRNGRMVCEDDCPAFIGKHCELAVGNRLVSSNAREGLKGGIADVRLWSRVLGEEEVLALHEGNERGVSKKGLEVWYRFDESEEGIGVEGTVGGDEERGRLLLDHSGHGRHASLIMPNEIRQMKHSGMQEYPKLPAWEGQPH